MGFFDKTSSNLYVWNDAFFIDADRSKDLDLAAIQSYATSFFTEEAVFKYEAHESGAESLLAFEEQGAHSYEELYGNGFSVDPYFVLKTYFVTAEGGSQPVFLQDLKTESDLPWLVSDSSLAGLFYDGSGACWCCFIDRRTTPSSRRVAKIIDSMGNRKIEIIEALEAGDYHPRSYLVSEDGNTLFFRDEPRNADGSLVGGQRLYRVDLIAPDVPPVDVFAQVPGNGSFTIASYSLSGNLLYFAGSQGTDLVGGTIDPSTMAYAPFEEGYAITKIEAY